MSIESQYILRVGQEHRKRFAQFFTPENIAELMCRWLLGAGQLRTVLDPAFGLGVFARMLHRQRPNVMVKGFDVDEKILACANEIFADDKNLTLHLQDYMYNDWGNKYDGIVCNPPYFKFHDYDNKNVLAEVERRIGLSLNGFTNLYTLFLLKSLYQLAESGRCAYIVPSEFMNADYGKRVKQYLLQTGMLRHVFVFNFSENVFDDALTTSCILLCANDENKEEVAFHNILSVADLTKIEEAIAAYPLLPDKANTIPLSEIDPEKKWKMYYQKCNSDKYRNLVPFANYAKVVRGIATGANDYFTFNADKANEFGIPERCLLPCICHSTDVEGIVFRQADFETLKNNGKKVYLINMAEGADDGNVLKYIAKGEAEDVDKKHLTSSRKPWYSLEKRKPAPIWVSVFNRKGLRFVRNETNTANLTTFHCVYPVKNIFGDIPVDLLFAYLLTDTARKIFEDNAREYGNGLQKFEPNDLNKGRMLDLRLLPLQSQQKIVQIYQANKYNNPEDYISQIDEILCTTFVCV